VNEQPGFRDLRLIDGGGRPKSRWGNPRPRPVPSPAPDDGTARGLAEDLAGPARELEERIGSLLAGDRGPLDDPQREELAAASEAAGFLSALVALLHCAEREEAGRSDPTEEFDVRYALWDAVEELAGRAKRKRVGLDLSLPDRPLRVHGGRCRTRATLRYVLRERLRAARPGSRVEISCGDAEGGAFVRIGVRGEGGRACEPTRRQAAAALARALLARQGADLAVGPGEWRILFPAAPTDRGDPRPDRGV